MSLRLLLFSKFLLATALSLSLLTPISGAPRQRTVKDKNIYRTSDVLVSRGYHTVLPKRCVIFIPPNLKDKMVETKPGGQFIMWDKFLRKNYGWLQKMEVSYQEALGNEPVSEAKMLRVKQTGKVVIAVYKNRPVSMLPPKIKPEEITKKEE